MSNFIINCRNCNDDPKWVSILPGHTRLSCPKDERNPSIFEIIDTNPLHLGRSQNFSERLSAVLKIQKIAKIWLKN